LRKGNAENDIPEQQNALATPKRLERPESRLSRKELLPPRQSRIIFCKTRLRKLNPEDDKPQQHINELDTPKRLERPDSRLKPRRALATSSIKNYLPNAIAQTSSSTRTRNQHNALTTSKLSAIHISQAETEAYHTDSELLSPR